MPKIVGKITGDNLEATHESSGLMSSSDKTKTDGLLNIKSLGTNLTLDDDGKLNVTASDYKPLGSITDYTNSNRLNLNTLKKGVYLLGNNNSNISGSDYLYLKATYEGVESTANTQMDRIINQGVYFIIIDKEINSDLSKNVTFGRVIYERLENLEVKRDTVTLSFLNNGTLNASKVTATNFRPVSVGDTQTISGKKTFTTLPQSSVVPTSDNQLVNKKYVDDNKGLTSIPNASSTTVGGLTVRLSGTTLYIRNDGGTP